MANFIIAYIGGKQPSTPEEGQQQRVKWDEWLTNLGDAVTNPGVPLMSSKMVTSKGVQDVNPDTQLTGYTIVEASDLAGALKMAANCPFLEIGDLQVSEMMQM